MFHTFMEKEILQTADIIANHAKNASIAQFTEKLQCMPPKILLTVGRGSSDHAAEYLSYCLMCYSGLPAFSILLSLNTIYRTNWQLHDALVLAISQSGGSADLLESVKNIARSGTKSLALLNTIPSPLSEVCDESIDIQAGEEKSVAATKSFVATLSVGLRVFSGLFNDETLLPAMERLPEELERAQELDWSLAIEKLRDVQRLYVVGRGSGLSIAKEVALKCKETCLLQGEAFSGAEVKHGPMALMNEQQVVLILAPPDKTQAGLVQTAEEFRSMGATVLLAADESVASRDLPLIDAGHSALQGLTTIQTFYRMAEKLSRERGINTDHPPHLNKVTSTR